MTIILLIIDTVSLNLYGVNSPLAAELSPELALGFIPVDLNKACLAVTNNKADY